MVLLCTVYSVYSCLKVLSARAERLHSAPAQNAWLHLGRRKLLWMVIAVPSRRGAFHKWNPQLRSTQVQGAHRQAEANGPAPPKIRESYGFCSKRLLGLQGPRC